MTLGTGDPFARPTALNMQPVIKPTIMEKYGPEIAAAGMALQGLAQTMGGKSQIDNIFANIRRTELNIAQMDEATRQSLSQQLIKNNRIAGMNAAKIGSSGVSMTGSPLSVMMHNYGQGMRDYDAIYKKGKYAIEDAYRSIRDQLDMAEDIGTSMMIGAVSNLAGSAYVYGRIK